MDLQSTSVARASREVLYDENSKQDLLEEFEFPPQTNQDTIFSILDLDGNSVLVGNRPANSESSNSRVNTIVCTSQSNGNGFPYWLLQILGTQEVPEEANLPSYTGHDEMHFYCQGDGLGTLQKRHKNTISFSNVASLEVHHSVTVTEVDEAVDVDRDSTSEENSSNNTVDYGEEDCGASGMFGMNSHHEESLLAPSLMEENISRPVEHHRRVRANLEEITANELILIDDVIRAAQEDVHKRSQVGLQEENFQGNNFIVDNDTCSVETSVSWQYSCTTFASAQSFIIDEHFLDSRNQENFTTSADGLSVETFEHTDDFNDPEKSHCFDSRTKEF